MNVLSIGNSFSQDAQRYIHHLAKKDGFEMRTANLYIGGCPLRTHYLNVLDDEKSYVFEFNDFDEPVSPEQSQAVIEVVNKIVK